MLCLQGPSSGTGDVWASLVPEASCPQHHSGCLQPLAGHHLREGFNSRTHPSPRSEPTQSSVCTCPTKPNTSHSLASSSDCP